MTAKSLKIKLVILASHIAGGFNEVFWSPAGCFISLFGRCNVKILHLIFTVCNLPKSDDGDSLPGKTESTDIVIDMTLQQKSLVLNRNT